MDYKKPNFNEIHYVDLPFQSNVYGLAKLTASGNTEDNKIIVATINGNFQCLDFDRELLTCRTTTVPFTYIPEIDSEIIAIDIFNQKGNFNGVVIGITFTKVNKTTTDNPSNFLNIYSEFGEDMLIDLERISQGCQSLPLSFISYKLYHADILTSEDYLETLFLLSGSDTRIHCYKMVDNEFVEVQIEKYFVEFHKPPAVVLSMCCLLNVHLKTRISAFGCRSGYIGVYVLDAVNNEILQTFSNDVDCPITSLSFFSHFGSVEDTQKWGAACRSNNIHLLVTNSFYPSFVYLNVFSKEAASTRETKNDSKINEDISTTSKSTKNEPNILRDSAPAVIDGNAGDANAPRTTENVFVTQTTFSHVTQHIALLANSSDFDCALTALIYDIDFDGCNEIIIGTYAGKILVYKLTEIPVRNENDSGISSVNTGAVEIESGVSRATSDAAGNSGATKKPATEFGLVYSWDFKAAILSVQCLDLTGDGLAELVILTVNGMHILQHDLVDVACILNKRINDLKI